MDELDARRSGRTLARYKHVDELTVERVMEACGWEAVWMPHAGDPPQTHAQKRVFVGTWTGPQRDMLCVTPCETIEDAELALAPAGNSLADAVAQSLHVLAARVASRTSRRGNPSTESRSSRGHRSHPTRVGSDGSP